MNPQQGQNPFSAMLASLQSKGGGAPGGDQSPPNPLLQRATGGAPSPDAMSQGIQQGANAGPGGGAAAKANMPSNAPGANPGSTDALIKALGAMNQVITATDDPEEIQIARQVILLLQKMVQMDQSKQAGKESALGQAQQQSQQLPPQQIQAPGGQPPPASPMGMMHPAGASAPGPVGA